jgi:Holliday junction DNA helicase RuvB
MFVKDPSLSSPEETIEKNLRPRRWDEYLGQEKVKSNLRVIIDAAKKRGDSLEHLLFYGSPGLGKTTLAYVIANELGAQIKTCTGPTLEKAGDLASLLTNLEDGDILFLDECHRVHKTVMEMLYSALEEFQLHIVMGKGPMARTMDLDLPRFTLIGATTRMALLPAPFRNRFGAIFQLQFYSIEEIEQILRRSSTLLQIPMDEDALHLISSRSRYTPRIANRILKRVRDFATIEGSNTITKEIAQKAFMLLEIDELGLEPSDRKIVETLIKKFAGGPVGIQGLAAALSEEEDTILDLYEPYLLQLGLLERTPRGRIATPLAYRHLEIPLSQPELL